MQTKRLWYVQDGKGSLQDVINQVLMYGTLSEIKELKQEYGEEQVREVFIKYPKKIYTAPAFHFISKFVLNISHTLDDQNYLKNTLRHIR